MFKRNLYIIINIIVLFGILRYAFAYEVKGRIRDINTEVSDDTSKVTINTDFTEDNLHYKVGILNKVIYVDIEEAEGKILQKEYIKGIVKGIRTGKHTDRGFFRTAIDVKEAADFDVTKEGNSIIVSIKNTAELKDAGIPVKVKKISPSIEKNPQAPVTLELKDAPITTILKLLAKKSGMNIIISSSIDRKISVSFNNVPAVKALYSIIQSAGYIAHREGDLIIVKSKGEADQKFETRMIHINHIDMNHLEDILKGFLSQEGTILSDLRSKTVFIRDTQNKLIEIERWVKLLDTPERDIKPDDEGISVLKVNNIDAKKIEGLITPFLSNNGKLTVDSDSNRIMIKDNIKNIYSIENVIKKIDIHPKQVMVEAAIIEVSLDDSTSLGINWQYITQETGSSFKGQMLGFAQDPTAAASPTGLFISASKKKISGLLEALQTKTDFNVLSHPKIMAINDQKAEIIVGNKLGFKVVTTSQSGITSESIEFLEVGTKLEFTPHITEDSAIIIDIHPEVSEGSISSAGLPTESTSEATTKVHIRNGETIIIGGLMKKKLVEVDTQVPVLGRIPLLGILFKNKQKTITSNEILVFITPAIIDETSHEKIAEKKKNYTEKFKEKMKGF